MTVRRSSRLNKGQAAPKPGFVDESHRLLPGTRENFKPRIVGGKRVGAVHRKAKDHIAYHISARRSVEVIGKKAVEAIINELDGLIDKKKCIHAVQRNQLSKQQRKKIIRSHMLMKEKMKMGVLDKVKARLVGDGSMQDRALYPDRYSPTVSLPAVMTVLAIAAKENRHIAALDVGKAYTNADMTGEEVYIEVDSFVTAYILKYKPDLKPFLEESGKMVFKLDKVSCPTKQDWSKLMRMMSYMQHNPHKGLLFPTKGGMEIDAYIDAAFCAHMDGKSHTGVIVRIGGALVYAKSTKQKIVSRDSTEAETIGLSDHTDKVMWFHRFMKSQGHNPLPPIIYQDNKSTISLVTKGGGKPRTRHLRARQYAVKEQVDAGEYTIEYMITEVMLADVLTKALQGAKYELFVDSMTLDF